MRVSYDIAADVWGAPETVMEFSKSGKSCSFPRPSPDGRYILHILADRTTYPIYERSSDLYALDLRTKLDRKLDAASSDSSESYPRWSSNGRWFSFISTRRDGLSALPYFAYFDAEGNDHKAILLPQEDPDFYDTFTDAYNVRGVREIEDHRSARSRWLKRCSSRRNPPGSRIRRRWTRTRERRASPHRRRSTHSNAPLPFAFQGAVHPIRAAGTLGA